MIVFRCTEILVVQAVKDSAIEVFKELGSGHSESVYQTALEVEMRLRAWVGPIMSQVPCPIRYKGHTVGIGYIDILVEDTLVVELKAVAKLTGRDETQVMKYLSGTGLETGLLINFNQVSGEVELIDIIKPASGLLCIPEELSAPSPDGREDEEDKFLEAVMESLRRPIPRTYEGRGISDQTDSSKG